MADLLASGLRDLPTPRGHLRSPLPFNYLQPLRYFDFEIRYGFENFGRGRFSARG